MLDGAGVDESGQAGAGADVELEDRPRRRLKRLMNATVLDLKLEYVLYRV